MTLKLPEKQQIVADVAEVAKTAVSCVIAEYRGLTSAQMSQFRNRARELDVHVQVVRNTLARRALKNTDFACTEPVLLGPVILAFAKNEPGAAAKLVRDFAKEYDKLSVKALALSGKLLDQSQLNAVADLPNREQALARLLAVMQAPIAKFVQTLAAPKLKLVRTLMAVKAAKEQN